MRITITIWQVSAFKFLFVVLFANLDCVLRSSRRVQQNQTTGLKAQIVKLQFKSLLSAWVLRCVFRRMIKYTMTNLIYLTLGGRKKKQKKKNLFAELEIS